MRFESESSPMTSTELDINIRWIKSHWPYKIVEINILSLPNIRPPGPQISDPASSFLCSLTISGRHFIGGYYIKLSRIFIFISKAAYDKIDLSGSNYKLAWKYRRLFVVQQTDPGSSIQWTWHPVPMSWFPASTCHQAPSPSAKWRWRWGTSSHSRLGHPSRRAVQKSG